MNNEPLKIVSKESYLGEEIGINNAESVTLTIDKRIGLAKKTIVEIKNIFKDSQCKVAGGIKRGIILWEGCVIPFLLNNCSCWPDIKKSDLKRLVRLQNLFLNTLLNTQKCPIPIMLMDLGIMQIPLRIQKEKLILYHHISCLPDESVASKIMKVQQELNLNGLAREVSAFLVTNEILDAREFSKMQWKKLVTEKTIHENKTSLLEEAKKYKKLDEIELATEEYGMKEYFIELNLSQARLKFRERCLSMYTCKCHFSSMRFSQPENRDLNSLFLCEDCDSGSVDVLSHWRTCSGLAKYHYQRRLEDDVQLAAFYADVISHRQKEKEK